MFTSQPRGERRHQNEEQHHRDLHTSSPPSAAAARRASWQQFGRGPPQVTQEDRLDQHQRQARVNRPSSSQLYRADRRTFEHDQGSEPLLGLGDDQSSDHDDWRQAAQMLTEHDESRLLAGHTDHLGDNYHRRQPEAGRARFGRDTTDAAPTNRRHQQPSPQQRSATQSPSTSHQQKSSASSHRRSKSPLATSGQSVNRSGAAGSNVLFTSHKMQDTSAKPLTQAARSNHDRTRAGPEFSYHQDDNDDEQDDGDYDNDDHNDDDDDDHSSISFAQSGCHSILSAWRTKAANKAAQLAAKRRRQQQLERRPTSVLSNSSSVGKKSSASTAYTLASRLTAGAKSHSGQPAAHSGRIPLGPKSAQHFVTNTRRRRRANELILSTLEARRRAISLNRQNLLGLVDAGAGSLFGSDIYLLGAAGVEELDSGGQHDLLRATPDDYQRLSLSPSPGAGRPVHLQAGAKSPSPLPASTKSALSHHLLQPPTHRMRSPSGAISDLGAPSQSPTKSRLRQAALVKQNRPKSLSQSSLGAKKPSPAGGAVGRPPLAKLDQNSSDLCSSNESSSGESSPSSTSGSSGSHFTQLVTSELASSRAELLDKHALNLRLATNQAHRRLTPTPPAPAPRLPINDDETSSRQAPRPASRSQSSTPKAASRTRPKQQHEDLIIHRQEASPQQALADRRNRPEVAEASRARSRVSPAVVSDDDDDADDETPTATSKLRRGTDLKRDSVRRLRMKQATSTKRPTSPSKATSAAKQRHPSDSSSSSSEQAGNANGEAPVIALTGAKSAVKIQPLSKSRRLEIENNPFLNRNQFRTMSLRSAIERTSTTDSPPAKLGPDSERDQRKQRQRRSTRSTASRGESDAHDESSIRQVEQMLRQMKPNEVVRSRSRENITSSGQMTESALNQPGRSKSSDQGVQSRSRSNSSTGHHQQRLMAAASSRGASPVAPLPPPKPHRPTSVVRRLPSEPPARQTRDEDRLQAAGLTQDKVNEFKTTTRLVREGAKSSDDLAFDLDGNRRQLEVNESWRQERIVERQPTTNQLATMTTLTSQKHEVRSQATVQWHERRPVSISPPAEFSDNNVSSSSPPEHDKRHYERQHQWNESSRSGSGTRAEAPRSIASTASRQLTLTSRSPAADSRDLHGRVLAPTPPPRPPPADRPLQLTRSVPSAPARGKPEVRSVSPISRQQLQPAFRSRDGESSGKPATPPRPLTTSKSEEPARHPLPSSSSSSARETSRTSLVDSFKGRNRSFDEPRNDTSARSKPIGAPQLIQVASLPKFERTADDEFRKRVDQLRQLARANLDEAYQQQGQRQQATPGRGASSTRSSTRPLSLNWSGAQKSELTSARDSNRPIGLLKSIDESGQVESARPTLGGSVEPRARSVPRMATSGSGSGLDQSSQSAQFATRREPVACTNLDDMLLADRYQRPMPAGSWRRSNSSLASLSSSRGQPQQQQQLRAQRPMSPTSGSDRNPLHAQAGSSKTDSVLSELLVMSCEPRQPRDVSELSPMRLVVKEKSAPTRNFAFVEQRPSIQRLESRRSPSPAPAPAPPRSEVRKPATGSDQQSAMSRALSPPSLSTQRWTLTTQTSAGQTSGTSAAKQLPTPTTSGPARELHTTRQVTQAIGQLASRVRSPSPRSPECGQTANSSSNDDSAIASSVSSPSLSFVTNNGNKSGHASRPEPDHRGAVASASVRTDLQSASKAAQLPGLRAPLVPASSASATSQHHSSTFSSISFTPAARSPASGVLQSILRRQQQQQSQQMKQKEQSPGSSMEPSANDTRTATGQSAQQRPTNSTIRTSQTELPDATAGTSYRLGQQAFGATPKQLDTRAVETCAKNETSEKHQPEPMIAQHEPLLQSKRVHFNDRTSVRSFESISSDHSNTTAIDRDQLAGSQAASGHEQQRQNQRLLIGSPDSMGSGSTSRLSCESPDFRRSSSGAAIYAIRGDPELESQATSTHTPTPTRQLHAQPQARAMPLAPTSPSQFFDPGNRVPVPPAQPHQQVQISPAPQLRFNSQQALGPAAGVSSQPHQRQHPVSISIAQQQFNQRQQQLGSSPASIRMTAPPAIGLAGQGLQQVQPVRDPVQPYAGQAGLGQQHQLIVSAASTSHQGIVGMRPPFPAAPQVMTARPMVSADMASQARSTSFGQHQPVSLEDEEDPDYALRLRQAASNRVFTFVQQQQQQQQQQLQPSPSMSTAGRGGGGGGGSQVQRRQPIDMSNFQTEV